MSEPKIAREVAETEVALWAEALGATIDLEMRERIVVAVMAGRVTFDDKAERFAYHLRKPLRLENGTIVEALTIGEANGAQLLSAGRAKDGISQTLALLAAVSEQPIGIVERLGQKDIMVASGLLSFFA